MSPEPSVPLPIAASPRALSSCTPPLLLWLATHLALIGLAAWRVQLAAAYPAAGEQLASHLLLGGQVIVAGLLFPWLLRSVACTIHVLVTAVPFQVAAAYLSGRGVGEVSLAGTFVVAWVLTLALWSACLRGSRLQMLGVATASCLTLGGAALRYLRLEFGQPPVSNALFETSTPLLTTFGLLRGEPMWIGWVFVAGLALIASALILVRRLRQGQARGRVNPHRGAKLST